MEDIAEGRQGGRQKVVLWLVPILFTLHNLEEACFIHCTLNQTSDLIPNFLQSVFLSITTLQFLLAVTVVTILPYLFVVLANTERYHDLGIYLLAVTQMVIFINVFSHLRMAIMQQSYVPGLVTALFINFPFSLYFFYTIFYGGWVNRKALAILFPLALFQAYWA